ncbi:hypothetical protein PR202_ga20574 [Eleusine coracana subsp. coracana]|uniref:Uncharacterized protein n=1 Tax=Eleusine coracana subsp. coracana TaxID=191504 RepID=A0AAV5CX12_ELECO|nr:hypothetical protein PR202_ga20574 [Eleusine coracana subsp. coracana]
MPGRDTEEEAGCDEAAAAAVRLAAKKIRKRRELSSSGASDPAAARRRLRSRRPAVLLPRRRASGDMSESSRSRHCGGVGGGASASARRLVGALWQMDKGMMFDGDGEAAHRSGVPWSATSTEVAKRSRSRSSKILAADGKGSRRNGHHRWFSVDMRSNGSAVELDVARSHVRRLIKEQNSDAHSIDDLKKQLAEEMESWKAKQKEKVANALQFIVTELDSEKKSRKRAERINKKLATALANTEASLQAATKEVERERKSKGRVEKICSELIRGIDEDKAEVEALKRETEKAQEELHKEREMLQLADQWREQRVQMKLLEARLQFEEKNAAVNQLRDELQAYLDTKKEQEPMNDPMQSSRASEDGATAHDAVDDRNGEQSGDDNEDNSSEGSEMHSIELNVDGNSKTFTWSYTPSSKGWQISASRHESFSDRGMDCVDSCGFEQNFQGMDEELEGDWAEGCSSGMLNVDHDEERYQAIKNLREQMLSGSGFIVSQGRENAEREYYAL